ncbi:hypothetical protein NKI48_25980 [Mesorhizobium sp. M0644]|uniref:VOC family protein n=1 Tax=Mesorhizobium sp. M0644 TaxID=2956979 RepID=UPI0033376574
MKSQEILANTTRLGPVNLRVVDIPAGLPVWRDVVGLSTLTRDGGIAELGVDGKTLIALHAGATTVLPSKSRDLFHIAIHVTTRKELARVAPGCGRLKSTQCGRIGALAQTWSRAYSGRFAGPPSAQRGGRPGDTGRLS